MNVIATKIIYKKRKLVVVTSKWINNCFLIANEENVYNLCEERSKEFHVDNQNRVGNAIEKRSVLNEELEHSERIEHLVLKLHVQ